MVESTAAPTCTPEGTPCPKVARLPSVRRKRARCAARTARTVRSCAKPFAAKRRCARRYPPPSLLPTRKVILVRYPLAKTFEERWVDT